jgi:single-strand DNA-binding protein
MLMVTVAGRLTKDSVLRYTSGQNATPVLGFNVAVDVGFGEKKHAVFVNCSLWGKRAEALAPYLNKGNPVTVIGEGDLRKWDTEQSTGSEITCKVSEVTMQGGGPGKQKGETMPSDQGFRSKPADKPVTAGDFADDDIPF